MSDKPVKEYIAELVARARNAQRQIEFASQTQVDDLVLRLAWAGVQPDFAQSLSEKLVAESGMGYVPHKVAKIKTKVKGALRDMIGKKSVGVVEDDTTRGLLKIAKPMGVVAAVMPVTNGEATPIAKALFAIKTRNAIIMAPHPKAVETNRMACARLRAVLKKQGYPEDLIIPVEHVSVEASKELMAQCDLVLATGGAVMVKAAYSSGTPSQGVGAGNAVSIIDATADLKDAADKIMRSKTFDYATSCSTENALAIEASVYDSMVSELEAVGGYLVSPDEKAKLQAAMWNEKGALSREIVAQPAATIARIAGISLPDGKSFFMVPETGVGPGFPFSQEKLSVTTTLYTWNDFSDAIDLVNRITAHSGPGHSCGIHSTDNGHIRTLGESVRVSRVMVRQPQCLANSGAWTNGMPMSLTLGCGSWGGNATSSNINWEHLLNYTWVSYPIPSTEPTDEELFGEVMKETPWE